MRFILIHLNVIVSVLTIHRDLYGGPLTNDRPPNKMCYYLTKSLFNCLFGDAFCKMFSTPT